MQPDPLNSPPLRPLPSWVTRILGILGEDLAVLIIYTIGAVVLPRLESLAVLGILTLANSR
jgi:hypothetical protein